MQLARASSFQAKQRYRHSLTVCRRSFCWRRSFNWWSEDVDERIGYRRLMSISTRDARNIQSCPRITSWLWLLTTTTSPGWRSPIIDDLALDFVEDRPISTFSDTSSTSATTLVTLFHQCKLLNVGILSFFTQAIFFNVISIQKIL